MILFRTHRPTSGSFRKQGRGACNRAMTPGKESTQVLLTGRRSVWALAQERYQGSLDVSQGLEGKIVFQSSFMLTTTQPLAGAASRALASFPTADLRS